MIRHFFTLQKIAEELKTLEGCELSECFTQEKNFCEMAFPVGKDEKYVRLSVDPKFASVYLKGRFHRAKKNSFDLFPDLVGEVLQKVSIAENNRILIFEFINSRLYALIFGGAASNLVAVNSAGGVFDAFKSAADLKGKPFELPKPSLRPLSEFPGETIVRDAAAKCSYLLGRYYTNQLIDESEIDGSLALENLTESEMKKLEVSIADMRKRCLESKDYFILSNEKDDRILSLIPLKRYPRVEQRFDSISRAVERRAIGLIKSTQYDESYKPLSKKLRSEIQKLRRSIEAASDFEKSLERIEKYKMIADLLSAQPNPSARPGKLISLESWDGSQIVITLDPKLSLIENASLYYDKVKKAKEELAVRKRRLPQMEDKLLRLEEEYSKLEEASDAQEIQKIEKQSPIGSKGKKMDEKSADKFRIFNLGEGFTLYVGKNAANNDELTMRFARPNDLWLHARGAGGSHCVLKLEKGQKAPKYILQKAASIAAYYSQARKAKYAPVAYTFKKYVRKPKGANPGSVVISREEVIMAEPGLPLNEDQ